MSQRTTIPHNEQSRSLRRARRKEMERGLRWHQLTFDLAQFWRCSPLYAMRLPNRRTGAIAPPAIDPWPGDANRGNLIIEGKIPFANISVAEQDLWLPANLPIAARDMLHEFAWLRDLRAAGGERTRRKARQLIQDWITQFPRPHDVTWHPARLGRRLHHWLALYDMHGTSAEAMYRGALIESTTRQAAYLSRVLPGPLDGLDLIAAAYGLTIAGYALPDGGAWQRQGFELFERAVSRQILPDGVHVERSPLRQLQLLQYLIDLRSTLLQRAEPVPPFLTRAIERVVPALRLFILGDGTLARFNDTGETDPWLIDLVLTRANGGQTGVIEAPQGGFQRLAAGRTVAVVDTGTPAAPPRDRFAHAGLMSFELSGGRDRIVVNCGAHPVDPQWRHAQRFSAAHSTLIAADMNSAQLLTEGLAPPLPQVMCQRGSDEQGQHLAMRHDGYQARLGVTHERRLSLSPDGTILAGSDILSGARDVPYVLRFHLHPDIQVTPSQDRQGVILRTPGGQGWRFRATGGPVTLSESVYLGRDGQVRRSQQILVAALSSEEPCVWRFIREAARREPPARKRLETLQPPIA